MKLENQVCTLEQSIKLEELGVIAVQDGCRPAYFWIFDSGMKWRLVPCGYEYLQDEEIEWHTAFTVAELGVMALPYRENVAEAYYYPTANCWFWQIVQHNTLVQLNHQKEDGYETEAQSRAALLIYLLERGKITAAECNQRLLSA